LIGVLWVGVSRIWGLSGGPDWANRMASNVTKAKAMFRVSEAKSTGRSYVSVEQTVDHRVIHIKGRLEYLLPLR